MITCEQVLAIMDACSTAGRAPTVAEMSAGMVHIYSCMARLKLIWSTGVTVAPLEEGLEMGRRMNKDPECGGEAAAAAKAAFSDPERAAKIRKIIADTRAFDK